MKVYLTRSQLSVELQKADNTFVGVTWIKKNGKTRTINCQPMNPFMDDLGYINVTTSKGKHKSLK